MFIDGGTQTTVTIDQGTWELWIKQGISGVYDLFDHRRRWTETGMRTCVEAVNRGALLLDQKKPGWVGDIIPKNLNMAVTDACIIGQTYGSYHKVGIPFGMDIGATNWDPYQVERKAVKHGFLVLDTSPYPYPLLDRVWVYMLSERHQHKQPIVLAPPA